MAGAGVSVVPVFLALGAAPALATAGRLGYVTNAKPATVSVTSQTGWRGTPRKGDMLCR